VSPGRTFQSVASRRASTDRTQSASSVSNVDNVFVKGLLVKDRTM
jgi:hypothetical protein